MDEPEGPVDPGEPDVERDEPASDRDDDVATRAEAVASRRAGGPAARGQAPLVGLDLSRMLGRPELEPIVQYLTYIQSRRGDDSHLLFVRYDDLDELAAAEGQETEGFLERLDQLGVVISTN